VSVSEEELAARALQRLRTASEAIILGQYDPPDPSLQRQMNSRMIDDYGVQLWTEPYVGDGGLPIVYHLKARGIYFDVKHLLNFPRAGYVVEYWVTLIGGTDWAGVAPGSIFRLVRMAGRDHPREVLHESGRFNRIIPVEGGRAVEIPTDDPRLIYEMSPTAFPSAYGGTELEGLGAERDDTGQYRIHRR